MSRIVLTPQGPFSLAAAVRFLRGFAPACYRGSTDDGALRLAFAVESPGETWPVVGLVVRQLPDGRVVADPVGEPVDVDRERTAAQLARMLSLDVDGTGFAALGEADPVVAGLQHRSGWLRPICFPSPYEAAVWAVLSHRVRMSQAAAVKDRLAATHGTTVPGIGTPAFPGPSALLALDRLDGVPEVKLQRLHGLARAAAEGRLDGARLRAMHPTEALVDLQRLPGIGPFSAELILIRGAGAPDVFSLNERRMHAAMVRHYRLPGSEPARLAEVARRWMPYRSWVSVLLRSTPDDDPGGLAAFVTSVNPRAAVPAGS